MSGSVDNSSARQPIPPTVVERTYASRLESVDDAEALVLDQAKALGFDEDDINAIGMSVREAMTNAIVHGNGYSAEKSVHLLVRSAGARLEVVIADEGQGFDLESIPDPLAPENLLKQSGRGILLVRSMMDEFGVRRLTPRGSELRLVKVARTDGVS
jgi:serine/threonine-protein kinase RsbW